MKFFARVIIIIMAIYMILYGATITLKEVVFPINYELYVKKYSKQYNLDPLFVLSVIKAESNFNANAQSRKDAMGLMQITKSTGSWIAENQGIIDFDTKLLLEPEVSIKFGTWYLNNLYEQFGDWDLVIAAYNAGRGNVEKWLKDKTYSKDGENLNYIPFKETDKYVKKVNTYYNVYKYLYKNNKLF
ncbi:lytic transglycosylase domain-containing protein [Clostridium tarantellae]|uniref:Transglycosylase SLT domain-containing protein n=1 Tax=Clostridium tarantellae TaxID=39493 RepID=A0A6I1MLR7_9CLOT|nr:lytic transglycosylase domain-containing protein [Clostridium tarantellae]MPQ44365.1 transglycosylase SLT domain-containing protein [Clostridium tarantellae]